MIISTEKFQNAKKYWLSKFAGGLNEVQLMVDLYDKQEYKTANYEAALEKETVTKLLRISKNNHLSLYVLLLTALNVLLHKYTGQDDIIVTSPTYSLSDQQYNKYVLFNTDLHFEKNFKELLMEVNNTVVDGYKNQFYPIRRIMDDLGIEDSSPLFKIILFRIH